MTIGKESNAYKPRFDFGSSPDPSGEQTGTIKELLDELNYEKFKTATGTDAKKSNSNGTAVTFDSLSGALAFLDEVAGIGTPKLAQNVPLATLKTIKLLYVTNDDKDTQLFRLLKSPLRGGKPTLEFYTTESSLRNQKGISIVDRLLSTLSTEVDPDVLRKIDGSFLTYPKLLECIAKENLEILEPIYTKHSGHPVSITKAFLRLAESLNGYESTRPMTGRPIHEALYTYLRALPLLHFVKEDQYIDGLALVKEPIDAILNEVELFYSKVFGAADTETWRNKPIMSVKSFPEFVDANALELAKLIQRATGISSERRDILKISNASSKVLCTYVFHQWNIIPLDRVNISVIDCIAALCTIRHQQKVKTKYSAYWQGQTQQDIGTSILRQMDDSRGPEELFEHDYIPHGINQIMFRRFSQFYAAFTNQLERYLAWKKLEAVRLSKYAECYLSNNVDDSDNAVIRFYFHCKYAAIQTATTTTAQ